MNKTRLAVVLVVAVTVPSPVPRAVSAITPHPAALGDGSDGIFNPQSDIEIDLGLAPTVVVDWMETSTSLHPTENWGTGVYDPNVWAVVFKFQSIHVPPNVDVTFINNHSNAPVVMLSQGDILIEGRFNLDGDSFSGTAFTTFSEPGPGGFRAGRNGAPGFGIGGGPQTNSAGGHAEPGQGLTPESQFTYGSPAILPLIGGSGGGGAVGERSGGAGGGAILFATDQNLTVGANGAVRARGGNGGSASGGVSSLRSGSGAGGAIRMIADHIQFDAGAMVDASGSTSNVDGGDGRIRLEANQWTLDSFPVSAFTQADPGLVFPTTPRIAVESIVEADGVTEHPLVTDPGASFSSPDADVQLGAGGLSTIRIRATDVPLTSEVWLRVTPILDVAFYLQATNVSGDSSDSVWEVVADLSNGVTAMQVKAILP